MKDGSNSTQTSNILSTKKSAVVSTVMNLPDFSSDIICAFNKEVLLLLVTSVLMRKNTGML